MVILLFNFGVDHSKFGTVLFDIPAHSDGKLPIPAV
jgi:hypothetical protein